MTSYDYWKTTSPYCYERPECNVCGNALTQDGCPCTSLVVPRYRSNWSTEMARWLRSIQSTFDGAHQWMDWIVAHTEGICESWGDRDKADRPLAMLLQLVESVELHFNGTHSVEYYRDEIGIAVDEWLEQ